MDYFISREGRHYGPYTLSDLQRYVASGEVLVTDLASSEGMTTPVQVGQIIGNIAAPPSYQAVAPAAPMTYYPDPPNLNWGFVLLLSVFFSLLFVTIWDLVQAAWMKKIDPSSQSLYFYIVGDALLVLFYLNLFLTSNAGSYSGFLVIAWIVLTLVGRYKLLASLERHFNQAEPMGLSLSGIMTFFFGNIYFQYHFNDINRRKALDRLYAAGR